MCSKHVHPPANSTPLTPWDSKHIMTPKNSYASFVEPIMQPPKYYDYVMLIWADKKKINKPNLVESRKSPFIGFRWQRPAESETICHIHIHSPFGTRSKYNYSNEVGQSQ